MPSVDTYDASLTSIEFAWPKGVTPLERIMLSAHGDLQRILSAFFARPIAITPIFTQTSPTSPKALEPSPSTPTTQKRQVHLVCAGRTVCVATSSVTITSTRCAQLFLKERYAIGQIFRKMAVVPAFELIEAGLIDDGDGEDSGDAPEKARSDNERTTRKMWRRYTLTIEGFAADIVEVFPDRGMFVRGEEWLTVPQMLTVPAGDSDESWTPCLSPTETLVHIDDAPGPHVSPTVGVKETWADSSNGLLRFMAVFIAVLLLLAVPRDGETAPQSTGSRLFARIARLLDVQGGE